GVIFAAWFWSIPASVTRVIGRLWHPGTVHGLQACCGLLDEGAHATGVEAHRQLGASHPGDGRVRFEPGAVKECVTGWLLALADSFDVEVYHHSHELLEGHVRAPAELPTCFRCVPDQFVNFRRSKVLLVDLYIVSPGQPS